MKVLTTKLGGELLNEDLEKRARVISLCTVENESGTILNLTTDEADDWQRVTGNQIDADVMPDALISELHSFLQREGLLE